MSESSGEAVYGDILHPELVRKGKYLNFSTTRSDIGMNVVECESCERSLTEPSRT